MKLRQQQEKKDKKDNNQKRAPISKNRSEKQSIKYKNVELTS